MIDAKGSNSSDRLDRIEAIIAANSQIVAENSRNIAENSRNIAENSRNIAELLQESKEQKQSISQLQETTSRLQQTVSQLAQVAQAALSMAQGNRENLEKTEQLTRRNANAIDRLEEKMEQYINEGREHREFVAQQIEGIKVETRRIVRYLFGEKSNNEPQ